MFIIKTNCNQKALAAMARALRKTLQKRSNILTRIFVSVLIAVILLIIVDDFLMGTALENIFVLMGNSTIVVFLFLILLLEDRLNGWIAGKQILPNAKEVESIFEEDGYTNVTAAVTSTFAYSQIQAVCEMEGYFVFFLSKKHGQVFDKKGFQEGDLQGFRTFIEEKTGKVIQYIR